MPFLPPNQQRQSTEGKYTENIIKINSDNTTTGEARLENGLTARIYDDYRSLA